MNREQPWTETSTVSSATDTPTLWRRIRANKAFQVILNLSPVTTGNHRVAVDTTASAPAGSAPPWGLDAPPTPNPYLSALAPRAMPTDASAVAGAPGLRASRPDAAPWQAEPVTRKTKLWQVVLRGLLVLVLVALLLTGLRAWFFPSRVTPPPATQLPAAAIFPTAASAGLATRMAVAYLDWDETNPASRDRAMLAAGWAGDPRIGWNGRGRQTASRVAAAQVQAVDATHGSVTVLAKVTPWTKSTQPSAKPTDFVAGKTAEVALLVPITVSATGVLSVSSAPAFVAVPKAQPPQPAALPAIDSTLTQQTRDAAQSFFTAYGAQVDLDAITAPGSNLTGLGGSMKLSQLTAWQVSTPKSNHAQALATVVWTVAGAEVTQTYRLTLQQVVSGDHSAWLVYEIN
jgi:hypothetical protein